jgi:ribosomal protein L29
MRWPVLIIPLLVVSGIVLIQPRAVLGGGFKPFERDKPVVSGDPGLGRSIEGGLQEVGDFGESPSCVTCRDSAQAKPASVPAASVDSGALEKHSGEWVAYGMVAESLKELAAGAKHSYRKKAILELRTSLNEARFDASDANSSPAERQAARKRIGELMKSIDGYRKTHGLVEVTRAMEIAETLKSSRFAKNRELKTSLNSLRFEVDGYGDASKIDELRKKIAEAEAVIRGQ